MSDTCTVEVGLLKKHPCGIATATKCANCERAICAKHAAPKMTDGKKLFLCPECARGWEESEKLRAAAAARAKAAKPAATTPKPPAVAPKPATVAPKPVKPPAPAGGKTELSIEQSMPPLEFPQKKPGDKK